MVKRLFKIQNLNASTIRTVMVVDCSRYSSPDELPSPGEQVGEGPAPPHKESHSQEVEERPQLRGFPAAEGEAGTEDGLDRFLSDIMAGRVRPMMTEMEMETKVARLLARNRTKPPEPNLLSLQGGNKKYLVFTTGCLTYSPHQIGKGPGRSFPCGGGWKKWPLKGRCTSVKLSWGIVEQSLGMSNRKSLAGISGCLPLEV